MEIQLEQIVLQLANFGILLFVMTKFLYRPILKILDERANKVSEGLKAAERSLQEQARIEEKKQAELQKAQKQAAGILDEATKKADDMGKQIIAEAKVEAGKAVKKEEQALKARLSTQEAKLKKDVSRLVVETTQAVLGNALSAKHQQEIIKKQLKDLKKLKVN